MTHPEIICWRPGTLCIKEMLGSYKGWTGSVHTYYGEVKVTSYFAASSLNPCTTMEMSLGGRIWSCRYDRAYHPRWLGRLANRFAYDVHVIVSECR